MCAQVTNLTTTSKSPDDHHKRALDRERYRLAAHIARALAIPMTILGFVWLILLVVDFTSGLSPALRRVHFLIWGVFIAQFLLEFFIAPKKLLYLRHNWLTAIALLVPAVRVLSAFRALKALAALRGLRLVRIIGSANRGMRALGNIMARRGFVYVATLSLLVSVAGAAGMFAFENRVPGSTLVSFPSALWWTAMILTTMGSDYFPKTSEGRLLCFLLAMYGFAVFGYLTATISSFFVARDADTAQGEVAGARQLDRLEREIAALHEKLDQFMRQAPAATSGELPGDR